jgi:hypothetical protein
MVLHRPQDALRNCCLVTAGHSGASLVAQAHSSLLLHHEAKSQMCHGSVDYGQRTITKRCFHEQATGVKVCSLLFHS